MRALLLGLSILSTSAFAVNCGDTIYDQQVELTQDLDCSSQSGFAAIELKGTSTLKGNGYKIISPNTSTVVYAEGGTIRIKNVVLEGSSSARGIQAYNVYKLVANKVTASNMSIGVDYYAEPNFACKRVKIKNSTIQGNTFGAKIFSPNCEKAPRIKNSDFSNSTSYALNIEANKVRVRGEHNNVYTGSANGILLSGSEKVRVKNLNLADSNITGNQLYVFNSGSVKIRKSTFGNSNETAVSLYENAETIVSKSSFSNSDVGLRVTNDSVASNLLIKKSTSESNSIGVSVESFGATKFSAITIEENNNLDYVSVQNQ